MRGQRLVFLSQSGSRFIAVLLILANLVAVRAVSGTPLSGAATPLKEGGKVYEINPDQEGMLWISDLTGGEIRRFNPANDTFTIYPVGGQVSDARLDSNGVVWWANYDDTFGSLVVTTGETRLWPVTGATHLSATALTTAGDLWLNDVEGFSLYRFTPQDDQGQLCAYLLPDGMGSSDYLLSDGSEIWFADRIQFRLARLDFSQDPPVLTAWELPDHSYAQGISIDANGRIWWADEGLGALARLEPDQGRIRIYSLSEGMKPEMLALSANNIWFSERGGYPVTGRIGILDPSLAAYIEIVSMETGFAMSSPDCITIEAEPGVLVEPVEEAADWSSGTYFPKHVAPGLDAYLLPDNYLPWGMALSSEYLWATVQGQQILLRLESVPYKTHLPFATK